MIKTTKDLNETITDAVIHNISTRQGKKSSVTVISQNVKTIQKTTIAPFSR